MRTKIIITWTIGAIMVASAVTACFIDLISKEVLIGAMVSIVLPFLMFITYLNEEFKKQTMLKKKEVVLLVKHETLMVAKRETLMEEQEKPIIKRSPERVRVDHSHIFAS